MADGTKVYPQSNFVGGIADYDKSGPLNTFAFGRAVDVRSNSRKVSLLPKTTKESGNTIVDLPKWGVRVGDDAYFYGDSGHLYKRTLAPSYSDLRTVASSHGNGLEYFGEDGYLYYTSDKGLGRYGQLSGTPSFTDDFIASEGGIPTNTHWLDLESGSSQYASGADSASISITGNLAIEAYIRMESLPAVNSEMVIFSKWDDNSNHRSYKLALQAISGVFGDGSDGALTISSNTTQAPKDANCTGTSGATTLAYTNSSGTFVVGEIILIHQTQGTGAGTWMRNKVTSVTGTTNGNLGLETALNANYVSGCQVIQVKQYTNVTVSSGFTWTAKAWDGTKGGILTFLCNGVLTVTGTISANGGAGASSAGSPAGGTGGGFRGGAGHNANPSQATQGESSLGAGGASTAANGSGGGGAGGTGASVGGGGGGGGNGAAGTTGTTGGTRVGGTGGGTDGTTDLTTFALGGGGGGGANDGGGSDTVGGGGSGGGGIFFYAADMSVNNTTGGITANGGAGGNCAADGGGGGGGAGGSIMMKVQTATLNTTRVTASGGSAGTGGNSGGNGGVGRIHLDYLTSYTGTTTPTIDASQDNSLVTSTTYRLRLGLSSNGTNSEFLTKDLSITTAQNMRVGVSWKASTSTATFYKDGISIGTAVGTFTSINDNTSLPAIGADFNSTARSFFDGKIDDVRVFASERTAAEMLANKDVEINVATSGLKGYYKLNNNYDDATSNANNLTSAGSPVFATDVPFSSPTSRSDLDQGLDTTGQLYTLPTSISESAANRQTFVPTRDPQKSIEVNVDTIGTGDWTLTVHDSLNRVIASKTVTNTDMRTGDFEFTFDSVWRPVIGGSYHFHLTVTTGTSKVVTTTISDMETADFHTYFQTLVTDVRWHPIKRMLDFIAVGNERYLATYDATTFNPHRLTFPSGYRVRSLALWREYLAIGCMRGSAIGDYEDGIIFFWDGYSKTYNFYVTVPEGGVNAMFSGRGVLTVSAGYQGDVLEYRGGDAATKKKQIPKVTKDITLEVFPGGMEMYQGLLRIGVGASSDSTVLERGVYTWGALTENQPDALTFDYPLSIDNPTSTSSEVGMVFAMDRKLLVGWRSGGSFGVDVVNPSGSPFAAGKIERLLIDDGEIWKEKDSYYVRADFEALLTGQSVNVKYKLDRASAWTESAYMATVGATSVRLPIQKGRHKEMQIAAELRTSVTTSPSMLELSVQRDTLLDEKQY
jgi:hypothetical protein